MNNKQPRKVFFDPITRDYIEQDGKPSFVRKTNDGKFVDSYTGDLLEVHQLPARPKPTVTVKPTPPGPLSAYEQMAEKMGEAQRRHSPDKLTVPIREPERPIHENFCSYWTAPLSGCCCRVSRGK